MSVLENEPEFRAETKLQGMETTADGSKMSDSGNQAKEPQTSTTRNTSAKSTKGLEDDDADLGFGLFQQAEEEVPKREL